ncbi:MAG: transposase [Clostridia bacterium]|nr:transposase [Clostridia bacterium]
MFFRKDRSLLNLLFKAASDSVFFMFKKLNKSENFTPGFICVLHTFGRSLQWNPHIHMLISEGGSGNFSPWRVVKHFHYELLRKSFQFTLLNYMEAHIGKSFRKVKSFIYKNCQNGFYVYAKPTLTNNQDVLKYIGRYLGRPVIATSRIDNYDGKNITFHYNRHEDNMLITETVSAIDFIKKLIIHIPEKHFKMIRYYGIYAKHHRHERKLRLFIPKEKRRSHTIRNSWRTSISLSFHFDPLLCKCGHEMALLQFYLKGTPFFENYKNLVNSS